LPENKTATGNVLMNNPSTPSPRYLEMYKKWELPLSLMGGTKAMRQAGHLFLPQHPAENSRVYQERARKTVLRNYFRKTVHKLVGQIFANPLKASADMPEVIATYLKNVDLTGRGLNSFAQSWFEDALVCGMSHVLVDFPVNGDATGSKKGADSQARPYAVHIPAASLISADWSVTATGYRLDKIRVKEGTAAYSGQGSASDVQIREITRDHWGVFRQAKAGQWQCVDEGQNSLGKIPLITLYTNRTGFLEATPPLEDLAWLNLEHYQIRSDQRNALNVASFPILAASGYDPEVDGPIEVGPNKVLTTSDTDGKYYYVESSGAALEAGSRELQDLEKAINQFSLQFETGHVRQTATGRTLDALEALSPLVAMSNELEDALNAMLGMFADWKGIFETGSITVSRQSLERSYSTQNLQDLILLFDRQIIDRTGLERELAARGILQSSLDFNSHPSQ
jgi:hypothetical protein